MCPPLSILSLLCLLSHTSDTVPRAVPWLPGPPAMTLPRACPVLNKWCLELSILSSRVFLPNASVPFPLFTALPSCRWELANLINEYICYLYCVGEPLQQKLSGSNISVRSIGSIVQEVGRACGIFEIMPYQWPPNLPTTVVWVFASPKSPYVKTLSLNVMVFGGVAFGR